MNARSAGKPRRRTLLDGLLIVLVLLFLTGHIQAALSQTEDPPQPAITTDAAPEISIENNTLALAPISSQGAAELIAAENAALGIPQYLDALPIILH